MISVFNLDTDLLKRFESGLDTSRPEDSPVPARIIGYGEISTIFTIEGQPGVAFKRMPLFNTFREADRYREKYIQYCQLVVDAGIHLPDHGTAVIEIPGKPVTLFIGQKLYPKNRLAHYLIQELPPNETDALLAGIVTAIRSVQAYNERTAEMEIAVDGQLSNWVLQDEPEGGALIFIDTSTPLYRLNGVEQLDAELLLQSAPSYLRWILRLFFLDDVLNRYYSSRQVCIDLAANLCKEQRPDLIPAALACINRIMDFEQGPVTLKEVTSYYREDRIIWTLFMAFRKIDRWIKTALLRRTYPFILPGKILR